METIRRRLRGRSRSRSLRSNDRSESGKSVCSSTGPDNEGRKRRRKAQNESEMDPFVASDTHSDSAVIQQATSLLLESDHSHFTDSENSHLQSHLADPLSAAAELFAALSENTDQSRQLPLSRTKCKPRSHASTTSPQLQAGLCSVTVALENFPQEPERQPSSYPKQAGFHAVHSYSSRRSLVSRRRKSLLSEVCTPDDFNQDCEGKQKNRVSCRRFHSRLLLRLLSLFLQHVN